MKEQEIIEAMAVAAHGKFVLGHRIDEMTAAYAIARAAIRDEVLKKVMQELTDNCEAQACDVIRAMKGKTDGQP